MNWPLHRHNYHSVSKEDSSPRTWDTWWWCCLHRSPYWRQDPGEHVRHKVSVNETVNQTAKPRKRHQRNTQKYWCGLWRMLGVCPTCGLAVGCLVWPDLAGVHGEEAIQEDKETDQSCGDQHASVPAQPGKIQSYLLSEVPPVRMVEEKKTDCCSNNRPTRPADFSIRVLFRH